MITSKQISNHQLQISNHFQNSDVSLEASASAPASAPVEKGSAIGIDSHDVTSVPVQINDDARNVTVSISFANVDLIRVVATHAINF